MPAGFPPVSQRTAVSPARNAADQTGLPPGNPEKAFYLFMVWR